MLPFSFVSYVSLNDIQIVDDKESAGGGFFGGWTPLNLVESAKHTIQSIVQSIAVEEKDEVKEKEVKKEEHDDSSPPLSQSNTQPDQGNRHFSPPPYFLFCFC